MAAVVCALLAALSATGCGGSAAHASEKTTSSTTKTAKAALATTSQTTTLGITSDDGTAPAASDATAPSVGTKIMNAGEAALIANDLGDGFTLDNQETGLTTYERDGTKLTHLNTSEVDTECGLLDIQVQRHGREIITQNISNEPAAGLKKASSTVLTTAWNPDDGQQLWATKTASSHDGGYCPSDAGGLGTNPTLAATYNGQWIVFSSGSHDGVVINAVTGAKRSDPALSGIIGNYVISGISGSHPTLSDPATGNPVGSFLSSGGDGEGSPGSGITLFTDTGQGQGLSFAVTGSFLSGGGQSSPSGLTSDGQRLIALYNNGLAAFQLPSMKEVWSIPADKYNQEPYSIDGDGGGVLIVDAEVAGGNTDLEGLDDSTGKLLWKVTQQGANYCAISNSEVMVDVNSDFTNLNVKTGKQESFTPDDGNDCPLVQAGGIGEPNTESTDVNVIQYLTP